MVQLSAKQRAQRAIIVKVRFEGKKRKLKFIIISKEKLERSGQNIPAITVRLTNMSKREGLQTLIGQAEEEK
jgi:hypothetical protein